MRTKEELQGVTELGSGHTVYQNTYAPEVLECFPNKHEEAPYMVKLNCPEFTSLCPKTGQPDFGRIVISYIPDHKLVESKSLKLYLFSFRNNGDFHEDCVNIIKNDLVNLLQPKYLEVAVYFNPRGGISILPFAVYYQPEYKDMAQRRMEAFVHE